LRQYFFTKGSLIIIRRREYETTKPKFLTIGDYLHPHIHDTGGCLIMIELSTMNVIPVPKI